MRLHDYGMRFAIGVILPACCISMCGQDTTPPGRTATASLADARYNSCAVRLSDGRSLTAGGIGAAGFLSAAELYLAEGSFLPATRMSTARARHTCTLLQDGRMLAAGGDADGTGAAEFYDPDADAWQLVAGTGQTRAGHAAGRWTGADRRRRIAGRSAGFARALRSWYSSHHLLFPLAATITFHGVSGSGCSTRTLVNPAPVSAAITSSGARRVKMSAGTPRRSIHCFGGNPTTSRPPGASTRLISRNPASSDFQK